ncbi:phage terminase small subunit [Citrobacter sp. TSA-1]|uniref:phage terminase small subunit n=1 Tax=Citrobacter sp. TSA-1 TaxID=184912 RepID=UPI0020B8D713|nr:phage terminase small subunit [Citrobacter sp. TSA-1]
MIRTVDQTASTESQHIKLLALGNDVKQLHHIELMADKQAFKRDVLLPRWLPHAQAYLDGDRVYQNPVLVYCIIWLFDTEQFEQALRWADIAIEQGQKTPENFRSELPTFVAHTILEWAKVEAERGHSIEPYFRQVFEKIRDTWRVNERLAAHYWRFAGVQLLRGEDGQPQASAISDPERLQQADHYLEQAAWLHPKVQVKTLRQRIAARLRALQNA